MYQYSLEYFKNLFLKAMQEAPPSKAFQDRLSNMVETITRMVYNDICHGLFEAHKRIYSFLIATSILRKEGDISLSLWNLLLRGVGL